MIVMHQGIPFAIKETEIALNELKKAMGKVLKLIYRIN